MPKFAYSGNLKKIQLGFKFGLSVSLELQAPARWSTTLGLLKLLIANTEVSRTIFLIFYFLTDQIQNEKQKDKMFFKRFFLFSIFNDCQFFVLKLKFGNFFAPDWENLSESLLFFRSGFDQFLEFVKFWIRYFPGSFLLEFIFGN
jgi:hypothetical protein